MTLAEIRERCLTQIKLQGPDAEVGFVLPKVWQGQKRMRLANLPGAPYGEPVTCISERSTMCFLKLRKFWTGWKR